MSQENQAPTPSPEAICNLALRLTAGQPVEHDGDHPHLSERAHHGHRQPQPPTQHRHRHKQARPPSPPSSPPSRTNPVIPCGTIPAGGPATSGNWWNNMTSTLTNGSCPSTIRTSSRTEQDIRETRRDSIEQHQGTPKEQPPGSPHRPGDRPGEPGRLHPLRQLLIDQWTAPHQLVFPAQPAEDAPAPSGATCISCRGRHPSELNAAGASSRKLAAQLTKMWQAKPYDDTIQCPACGNDLLAQDTGPGGNAHPTCLPDPAPTT